MACVLMDMLMIRMLKANKQIEGTSVNVFVEKPINDNEIARETNATVIGLRLSYLDTSHPDKGNPIKELMGMNNSIVPNSASL
jgi:hypothetical protein